MLFLIRNDQSAHFFLLLFCFIITFSLTNVQTRAGDPSEKLNNGQNAGTPEKLQKKKRKRGGAAQSDEAFRISRETTYFTKPLLENGQVDYAKAINNTLLPKDFVPSKNGAIQLLKAIGWQENKEEYFQKLWIALDPSNKKHCLAVPTQFDSAITTPQEYIDHRARAEKGGIKVGGKEYVIVSLIDSNPKPWKKEENLETWKWIQLNRVSLEFVAQGTKQPFYYLPHFSGTGEDLGKLKFFSRPATGYVKTFSKLLLMRALNHLGEDRVDKAAEDLLVIHELACQLGSQGTTFEILIANSIVAYAVLGDYYLAKHPKFTANKIKHYIRKLESLPPVSDAKESINLFERCESLYYIQDLEGVLKINSS